MASTAPSGAQIEFSGGTGQSLAPPRRDSWVHTVWSGAAARAHAERHGSLEAADRCYRARGRKRGEAETLTCLARVRQSRFKATGLVDSNR